jgi:hypothetical protein
MTCTYFKHSHSLTERETEKIIDVKDEFLRFHQDFQ